MKHSFKAHPLQATVLLKPFLFVLIIPVVRGLIELIFRKDLGGIFGKEMLALAAVAVISVFYCRAFSLTVSKQGLIIKKGLFFKTCSVISPDKLSSVSMAVSPLDALFGAVNCSINTEAGRRGKPDFSFKLRKNDAKRLSELLYGGEPRIEISFSPVKIAIMAATTSSAVSGIIVGAPVINKAGDLLGLALSEMIFDEINEASSKLSSYFPPIVNIITILFILSYGFSVVVSFFKHINLRLFNSREKLEIKSGFFVRKRTLFRKSSINDVCIEQSPLMRIFRLFSMKATVGGYGDTKSEKAVVAPCGKRRDIIAQFDAYFPFLKRSSEKLKAKRGFRSVWRFLWLPRLFGFLILSLSFTLSLIFSPFSRFILFLALVAMVLDVYYAVLCIYNYRHGGIALEECITAHGSKLFSTCELYCRQEKIGVIKLIRTPADRRYNTCKLKLTVRSENADSLRVRNISYPDITEKIENSFNIKGING